MKRLLPPLALAALLALAACNSEPKAPEVVDANPDPMATALANAPKVELPPSIKADKTFRCSDNSLIYVTFFDGEKQANVRTEQTGTVTQLKAEKAGDPYTADGGWKLTGNPSGISVSKAGKGTLTCKV